MKKAWIGIDPGATGCACMITEDQIHFHPFTSATQAAHTLMKWQAEYQILVMLERVHSTPNDGHVGAFKFGMNYGIWQGILASLNINYHQASPQKWKRAMLGKPIKGEDKKAKAVKFARQLFPVLKHTIYRKQDHDKAEAFLLAYYLKIQTGG